MRWLTRMTGVLALAGALAACGGGGTVADPQATPAKVEITAGAVLFTESGESRALKARVLDSNGREITTAVSWESSNPVQIGVSSNGELTALGGGGVSQITARVGDLRSAPMLAVHTPVPTGSVLLTDEQIVGDPEETMPGAAPSAANTYRVRLSGVAAPVVGDLLINTGGKVVVGRVQAVQSADGVHQVTLGLLPLREVFPQLRIDEVIDLGQADATIPDEVRQNYDVRREGNTYRFTPKPGLSVPAAVLRPQSQRATSAAVGPVSGTVALPPFKKCEATLEGAGGAGSLPVKLDKLPSFSLDFSPKLHTRYTPETGLERMVVSTDATFTADNSLEFSAGFDGKLTCTIELVVLRIPVGGPVAAFLGGLVTLGAGVELSGKVTLPGAKISNTYERKNTLELGVACAPACALVNTLSEAQVKHTADIQGPDLNDLRVEPSIFGYGLAQLAVGNPFLTSLRFNAFYGKLGVAYQTSLASREAQIASPGYRSNYQLAALFKGGLETEFGDLAAWLGFNGVAENLIELSKPLATSPTGRLTVDRASFATGDAVQAVLDIDVASSSFLSLYNIDAVLLMRKTGSAPAREIARLWPAAEGQTQFTIPFVADSDGAEAELHAFVLTKALPLELAALQLGQAAFACVPPAGSEVCLTAVVVNGDASYFKPIGMNAQAEVLFARSYPYEDRRADACGDFYLDNPIAAPFGAVWQSGSVRELPNRLVPVGIADDGTVGGNLWEGSTRSTVISSPAVAVRGSTSSIRLAQSVGRSGNQPDGDAKYMVSMSPKGRATYWSGDNGYTYSGVDLGYCIMSSKYCRKFSYLESVGPDWGAGTVIRHDQLPESGVTFNVAMDGDAAGRVGWFHPYGGNDYFSMINFQQGVLDRRNQSIDDEGRILFAQTTIPSIGSNYWGVEPPSPYVPAQWEPRILGRSGHALVCSPLESGTPEARVVNLRTGELGPVLPQAFSAVVGSDVAQLKLPCDGMTKNGAWMDPLGRLLASASSASNPRLINVIITPRGQTLP